MEDAEELARIANNKNIFDQDIDSFPFPYSLSDAEFFISSFSTSEARHSAYAIEYENKPIGSVGLEFKDDVNRMNVEIGYFISEEFWNRGIATNVVKEVVRYVFENFDVLRIYAEVFENNPASMKVLKKAGFEQEAVCKRAVIKNNVVQDLYIFSVLRTLE